MSCADLTQRQGSGGSLVLPSPLGASELKGEQRWTVAAPSPTPLAAGPSSPSLWNLQVTQLTFALTHLHFLHNQHRTHTHTGTPVDMRARAIYVRTQTHMQYKCPCHIRG